MDYREVFKAQTPSDPGQVFYTITADDIGKTTIVTEAGPIYLNQVIGRVLDGDVGIRLYRVPGQPAGYRWTAENRQQRNDRLKQEAELKRQLNIETPHPFKTPDGNKTYCKTCGFTRNAGKHPEIGAAK
jgi:hypothetical protein